VRPRLFISYKHEDPDVPKARIDALADRLEAAGADVTWDDNLRTGDDWRAHLDRWLVECDAALIFLSPASIASLWVVKEISLLATRARASRAFPLLPVAVKLRTADVDGVEALKPSALSTFQRLSFDPEIDWDAVEAVALERLAELKETLGSDRRAQDANALLRTLKLHSGESIDAWFATLGSRKTGPEPRWWHFARAVLDACVQGLAEEDEARLARVEAVIAEWVQGHGGPERERRRVLELLWPYTWVARGAARAWDPDDGPARVLLRTDLGEAALGAHLRRLDGRTPRPHPGTVSITAPDAATPDADLLQDWLALLGEVLTLPPKKLAAVRGWVSPAPGASAAEKADAADKLRRLDEVLVKRWAEDPRLPFLDLPGDTVPAEALGAFFERLVDCLPNARVTVGTSEAPIVDLPADVVEPMSSRQREEYAARCYRALHRALRVETGVPAAVTALLPSESAELDDLFGDLE